MSGVKPRLLDLFCGAGGAAMGYARAGFEVVGVDIAPQKRYPFEFIQADAFKVLEARASIDVYESDVVHASPPCQHYSDLAHRNRNAGDHPDCIPRVRALLEEIGLRYVIENVEGSPLCGIRLCGTMFPELRVLRHRIFESNVSLEAAEHKLHPLVFTMDKRKAHYGKLDQDTSYVMVNGGGNCTVANKRDAMGIDWMTGAELNEAIPPAYTEHIGRQLIEIVG